MGRDLGDRLDLDALPVEALDLGLDVVRRRHEIIEAAGPVDPPGDELRVPGEQAQDVDVFKEPRIAAVGVNGEPPPVVAGHQQQRVEHEVVEADRGDVERANFGPRPWTQVHARWLSNLSFAHPAQYLVLREY